MPSPRTAARGSAAARRRRRGGAVATKRKRPWRRGRKGFAEQAEVSIPPATPEDSPRPLRYGVSFSMQLHHGLGAAGDEARERVEGHLGEAVERQFVELVE